jgi:hypothetical protein
MSQVVYTELEGQPLRWEYKGVVPRESRKEASRTPTTWSVSQTGSSLITGSTGTNNDVYSSNMLGQVFTSLTNAMKVSAIQLYGYKVGTPPNHLYVELRKAEMRFVDAKPKTISGSATSPIDVDVESFSTNFPAGGNNIILVSYLMDSGFSNSLTSASFYIKKGTTKIFETVISENLTGDKGRPAMIMALDTSPAGNDTYVFGIHGMFNAAAGGLHFQALVINVSSASWARTSTPVSVAAGTTATVLSLNTGFETGEKIVVLAYVYASAGGINAGNIRLKMGTTIISSNEFRAGGHVRCSLGKFITLTTNNPTFSIEVTNNTAGSINFGAILIAFKVNDGADIDTSAVSLTANMDVTVGTLNIPFNTNVVAISLGAASHTATFGLKAKLIKGDDIVENRVNWSLVDGIIPLFTYYKNLDTATITLVMNSNSTGPSGEAKIIAFQTEKVNIFGMAYYKILDTVLSSGSIAPTSIGTTAAWISISITPQVLRASENYGIVVYTIGGNASNKYVIQNGGGENLYKSSNSGGTWNLIKGNMLGFKVDGYQFSKIYNGSISNNIVTPLGKVLAALIVKAQTSGTMEFAGFDDHTLTCSPVSSTASSQTLITVLAPDAPRLRDVEPSTTLNWEIWAAGTGLATVVYTQRHTYYTTNPVYPKDFGYGELYLIADEIPPQGLVVLNDNTAAALYNSSTTATRVDSYELFRVPVRKIEVVQEPTSGRIIMYLIGLP